MDGIKTDPAPPVDLGVSARALAIARTIDRLETGEYHLHLEKKSRADGGGWYVEVQESTTVRFLTLEKP